MPPTIGGVTIDPQGQTLTVTVTPSAKVYTDAAGTSLASFPATVTTRTSYWMSAAQQFTVSVKSPQGVEIADGVGQPLVLDIQQGVMEGIAPVVDRPGPEDQAQSGTYAPRAAVTKLAAWGCIGDSRSNLGANSSGYQLGYDHFSQACVLSKGSMRYGFEDGINGTTTAQMLTRFPTTILSKSLGGCVILGGTNDPGQGIALGLPTTAGGSPAAGSTIDNLQQMILLGRAAGLNMIWCTETPRTLASGIQDFVSLLNAYMTAWCGRNGVHVADYYSALVDPATGAMRSIYDSGDGIHPNPLGCKQMALALVAVANKIVSPAWAPWLPWFVNNTADVLAGIGMFLTDGNADGVADNWSNLVGASATPSLVADADGLRKWQRMSVALGAAVNNPLIQKNVSVLSRTMTDVVTTNASTTVTSATGAFSVLDVGKLLSTPNLPSGTYVKSVTNGTTIVVSQAATASGTAQTMTLTNFSVGDTLAVSGRIQTSGLDAAHASATQYVGVLVGLDFTAGTGINYAKPIFTWPVDVTDGIFYMEVPVPAGTTGVKTSFQLSIVGGTAAAACWAQVTQLAVVNLTRLGVA